MTAPVLLVEDLTVDFARAGRRTRAVDGLSFELGAGETLGVVGESGSGKSATALALLRLIPSPPGQITGGRIVLEGRELRPLSEREMRAVRGNRMSMIFQEPMTALNPVLSVARQVKEVMRLHQGLSDAAAHSRAIELLADVGIADAGRVAAGYPHQLSGGMRQRVMIAAALSCRPSVLIADEPTTALDVTIQAQILDLVGDLRRSLGTAMLFISHDLGVVSTVADRVMVMYAGRQVEQGRTADLFAMPLHPYTRALIAARPQAPSGDPAARSRLAEIPGGMAALQGEVAGCAFAARCALVEARCRAEKPPLTEVLPGRRTACWEWQRLQHREVCAPAAPAAADLTATPAAPRSPVLEVEALTVEYPITGLRWSGRRSGIKAANEVSLTIRAGETLALVGESGCGKSTTGRAVLRLLAPTAGRIVLHGADITHLDGAALLPHRKRMQMVFQDPFASLNPRLTIAQAIAEPLAMFGMHEAQRRAARVAELLEIVGLRAEHGRRYPHEFSGGQRQRIGIARALAPGPDLIVCDEPVSALDVSVQAQILNLLMELQDRRALALLFISHDLAVVRHLSHRVAVMYLGRIVETASRAALFDAPLHPYTAALLAAAPAADAGRCRSGSRHVGGEAPSPANPPPGCAFHTRCPRVAARCKQERPGLREASPGRWVACHLV